jgi:CRISPR-associated endonuclease Csn1
MGGAGALARANARDIEKWLLAEECGWICPYTGKAISVHSLFVEPEFEIEHIYPYALSLDDSFANKTLCHRDANREKGRRLPSQAFSKQRLEEILQRVARFNGDLRDAKLRRFKATEIPEGFTNRQLNDSSHLARAASQYLGLLYGGVNDSAGTKRIHTRVGGLTAQVRRLWGLNQILSGTDEKTREDHRHHAIDAVVVGCTDTRTVQEMMRVASEQITFGRSRLSELPLPFPDFFPQLVDAIEKVVVSHRQSRKVGGKLHAETLYSRPIRGHDGGQRRHVRWPWSNFVRRDQLDLIVDPRLRACVIEQYEKSAKPKPADAFKEHPPVWMMKDGRTLPIRAVRVAQAVNPRTIGKGPTQRFVESTQGSNHHVRILAELRPDGTEKTWLGKVFTRFDVLERRRQRLPDVNRETETGYAFKFSLAGNEYVEIDDPDATGGTEKRRVLYRVVAISQDKRGSTRLRLVRHNDGRTRDDRKKAGQDWEPAPSTLFALHARKVFVNYLGEVKGAGG